MVARQEAQPRSPRGRERQKSRTRRALVAAAAELLRAGRSPTIAEVAEAAEVSRATAYRYFPTQEILLAEVALLADGGPLFPAEDESVALPAPEAVGRLVRRIGVWAYESEPALRLVLRLSLDPATGVRRPGHRVGWIAEVLAPVRAEIDPETYEKLAAALTLLLGIDPIVVMTDIADVSREQALDTLEWTARTLVEGALRERSPARSRAIRRGKAHSNVERPSMGAADPG
jgi:AcrR family transcriptional regulator